VHARPRSLSPLADSRVNDSLLQIIPHFNEALLQLVDVTHTTFIYKLLHDFPDLAVDGVQIWSVWRREVRTDEVQCLLLKQLDGAAGPMYRSAILLKNKRVACDTFDRWKHLLRVTARHRGLRGNTGRLLGPYV